MGTVEQDTAPGNPHQGKTPALWRAVKIVTMPDAKSGRPNTSAHILHLGVWIAKEYTTQLSTGWDWAFPHLEKRQSKMSSGSVQSLLASAASGGTCRAIGLCGPLLCLCRRTLTLPHQILKEKLPYTPKQNKRTLIMLEIGKDFPSQGVKCGFFIFGKEGEGPRPMLTWLCLSSKTVLRRLPFPTGILVLSSQLFCKHRFIL